MEKEKLARIIATGGGLGFLPKAPGTWGAIGAVAFYALLGPYLNALLQSLIAIVLILSGIWASEIYAQKKDKDPQEVVIDEIAGQWLTLVSFNISPLNLILGFFFFRLFDIWKPLPIKLGEKLPGGIGIMMDDILAGIAANLCLRFINQFLLS